ncbi:MAG TPA: hypothetical protein VE650_13405 [Acetobacteraceae bacterium]|nr:hypothetical protein [Acetobacteraceae bacterium]
MRPVVVSWGSIARVLALLVTLLVLLAAGLAVMMDRAEIPDARVSGCVVPEQCAPAQK